MYLKIVLSCSVAILIFSAGTPGVSAAEALQFDNVADLESVEAALDQLNAGKIKVLDEATLKKIQTADANARKAWTKEWLIGKMEKLWRQAGSQAVVSALSNALNTIAFDTATWLGSGGKGQKPMFITEGWGEYLTNIADNAAGTFIEELGKLGPTKFNLCQPDMAMNIKIGLGLINVAKPGKPACTFSQMKENWEKELHDPNFLSKFQNMFDPASNDLGIALSLQTGLMETQRLTEERGKWERIASQGWLNIEDVISGRILSPPQDAEKRLQQVRDVQTAKIAKTYNDAFVEASNIFLNQLAMTLFNNLMGKIGQNKSTTPGFDWSKLRNPFAAGKTGGIAAAKESLKKIIEPKFNVRGDYDILGELSQCPTPTKAGPTNCVIDEKFKQAVQNKITVGQAIKGGYLNSAGVFGYIFGSGLEPSYTEGYPHRSMIILRKFRILPVGWELAAQYLKNNADLVGSTKNLDDLVACFDPDDEYTGYNDGGSDPWCQGLVDPNWVLKAPLNYCRREGSGPEIMSRTISGAGNSSALEVVRNENYCADEQACIKENSDGSCQIYGYCTEERRTWNFAGKACEPRYNTCQTFKAAAGNSISYLEDTLNYQGCSVDNAGCLGYCVDYDYVAGNYTCTTASVGDKIYLDRDAQQCQPTAEGCHEFVRTKNGLGANLAPNSGFEADLSIGGWSTLGATSSTAYEGQIGLLLNSGPLPDLPITVGPSDFDIGNDAYTLSFYANGCASTSSFALVGGSIANFRAESGWQFNQLTYIVPSTVLGSQVSLRFNISGAGCVIDALKLERGYRATTYTSQATNQRVYEKLLPDYYGGLGGVCYDAAGNLKSDAPSECSAFARTCRKAEVGCELFTAKEDKMSIPAIVGSNNYCVAECAGFKAYLQTETYFDSLKQQNLIAKSAGSCSAQTVGCDEFTNLDAAAAGGEAKEYYSYLRQCVKPGASCGEFYAWEGSNETGFQLRVMTLDAVPNAGDGRPDPRVTDPAVDASLCNETIYNLPPTDPAYNPDCREFYNTSGDKRYHLYTYTVSCSDDCHPYRRTEVNIDTSISIGSCVGSDKDWGDHNGDTVSECAYCKNGGTWSAEHSACLYQTVPSQGRSCQAAAAGCREYTGSTGRNVRVALNHDFEDGTRQGWSATAGTLNLSNESLVVGGRSLALSGAGGAGSIYVPVAGLVQTGRSFVLSFIAKAASGGASSLSARLQNSIASSSDFGAATGVIGDWRFFEVNLASLNHQVDSGEQLIINSLGGNGDFFIDNIKLTEITDRYYLIVNSWNTPAVCHADLAGNPVPDYMLGCEEYGDRNKQIHYLKSFAALCSESAVGCEVLTDTQNSTDEDAEAFNTGTPTGDEWTVPADEYIYAVYDRAKQCQAADKGCERLGAPYNYDGAALYQDVYIKNDPDGYYKSMCTLDASFCQEYTTADGLSYFKDPGDQVCEWRQAAGSTGWGWYRKKINRCDTDSDGVGDGAACLKDVDCGSAEKCLLETADTSCPVSNYKTIGLGGAGNRIAQPNNDWAGLCPNEASGCSELIDPMSRFSPNLIFNGDFQDIDSSGTYTDGWTTPAPYEQSVNIEPFTLYRLAGTDSVAGNSLRITCPNIIFNINPTNSLLFSSNTYVLSGLTSNPASVLVYSDNNDVCTVRVDALNIGSTKVELKRVAMSYQLDQDLDKQSCNGAINPDDGCVLFNQRRQSGGSIQALVYDADRSQKTPYPASDDTQDSNLLVRAEPDRVCDKWLACKSKVSSMNDQGAIENYCFDIGVCNGFDGNGNCNSFIISDRQNQNYPAVITDLGRLNNASGYAKAAYLAPASPAGLEPDDYLSLGAMRQVGKNAQLTNGDFETAGSDGYPVGWSWQDLSPNPRQTWDASIFRVVNNPVLAEKEGIRYPVQGGGFLKLGSTFRAVSEYLDVAAGSYVITAYLNTKNASAGNGEVSVIGYDAAGGSATTLAITPSLILQAGNDWLYKVSRFTVPASISRIKINLYGNNSPVGNFYFDDISIRPALESKDLTPSIAADNNYWYTPASCRLYPQNNSLACEYTEESGARQRGWYGYCLEHDRYPGSADACLLWWPVDKVMGDGIEENAGYSGRQPLYYCTEGTAERLYEYHHAFYYGSGNWDGCEKSFIQCPEGYNKQTIKPCGCNNCSGCWDYVNCYCVPNGQNYYVLDGNKDNIPNINGAPPATTPVTSRYDGWYPPTSDGPSTYQGGPIQINASTTPFYMDLCDGVNSCTFSVEPIRTRIACTTLVQTVTPSGNNKYWSGRVYSGSDYRTQLTNQPYTADYPPFGSLVPPYPASNPYEWDSVPDQDRQPATGGNQPLYELAPDTSLGKPYQARAGSVFTCLNPTGQPINCINVIDNSVPESFPYRRINKTSISSSTEPLKRLFSQSYGTWSWTGSCKNDSMLPCRTNTDCSLCVGTTNQCANVVPTTTCASTAACLALTNCISSSVLLTYDYCSSDKNIACTIGNNAPCIAACGGSTTGDCASPTCISMTVPVGQTGTDPAYDYCENNKNINCSAAPSDCQNGVVCGTGNGTCANNPALTCNSNVDCLDNTTVCQNHYVPQATDNWLPPDDLCPGGARPAYDPLTGGCGGGPANSCLTCPGPYCDWCAVTPTISNILVNKQTGNITINKSGLVNLTFNSDVNNEQLPLVMYEVDWGDEESTTVSGVEMRDRPSTAAEPHSLYRLYNYWELKAKDVDGSPAITCSIVAGVGECRVTPSIRIKDNWGWCNGDDPAAGRPRGTCSQYVPFAGEIIVREN